MPATPHVRERVVEHQPEKSEIPFYSQHESGWLFCENGTSRPLVEFDFIEFRRPYFVFRAKFLTSDESVRESIYHPIRQDPYELSARYFLRNRKSTDVIDLKDCLTSRLGETDTITLADRRKWKRLSARQPLLLAIANAVVRLNKFESSLIRHALRLIGLKT